MVKMLNYEIIIIMYHMHQLSLDSFWRWPSSNSSI